MRALKNLRWNLAWHLKSYAKHLLRHRQDSRLLTAFGRWCLRAL